MVTKYKQMKVNNIIETIGNTPHVKINNLYPEEYHVWIKLERANPGGSIKDRIAMSMVEDALQNGVINSGTTLIEPTSGNTGIGLAMVCAVKKLKLILVMPDTMSIERRKIMQSFGAELVLTPGADGMKGSIAKARELQKELSNAWIPLQFENESNPEIHRKTTAKEIINDFPDGIDYLITGVGTGGHITGLAEILKEKWPNLKVFAVEPEASQVIAGKSPGKHMIQGIGAGFIPDVLNTKILDGTIPVEKEEAFGYTRKAAKHEGIFCGISTGGSLAAVAKKLADIPKGSTILTFNYDTGERYLSIDGLF
jgi:cysteine synthase